jgi:hypothetical protein
MRWLILLMTSMVLGACAGSIGPQINPIGSPPPREPTATDRVDPTKAAVVTQRVDPAPTSVPVFRAALPDLGAAPELNNEVWLNTDQPLRLADLRGKVVLIDMWTYG